jgi:hypothetical protein
VDDSDLTAPPGGRLLPTAVIPESVPSGKFPKPSCGSEWIRLNSPAWLADLALIGMYFADPTDPSDGSPVPRCDR